MKYVTFVVPSYNSQDYLHHCIDTLLPGGDDVEIIIVNDGSKDDTGKIADEYAEKYPNIVRVVHKENGGHGSGVNKGIELATGKYLKVVDSDDWVDENAYKVYLETIKNHVDNDILVDVYFTNFVYENKVKNSQYILKLNSHFPTDRVFGWKDVKRFKTGQFLMMHSLTYNVETLRRSNTKLLEKTFYVDHIFTYQPMAFCKTMYFIDVDLYRYFIGRNDQSINVDNMVKRYDQQLRVIDYISNIYSMEYLNTLEKNQKKYMVHLLGIISFTTLIFIYGKYDKIKGDAYKAYWKKFKENNKALYSKIRWRSQVCVPFLLPRFIRKWVVIAGYKVVCKITKWG